MILAKIDVQFIRNCLGIKQSHNVKVYLRAVVVEPPGHNYAALTRDFGTVLYGTVPRRYE